MIAIRLQNPGPNFVDAAVLYVDARGGVQAVQTWSENVGWVTDDCSIALPPRASTPTVAAVNVVLWKDGAPSTAGTEHVVIVAAERPKGAAPTCFRFLTQPTLQGARGDTSSTVLPSTPQMGLESLLVAAVLARPSVRGSGSFGSDIFGRSTMSDLTFDVTARPFRAALDAAIRPRL